MTERFSRRHGYAGAAAPITVREDAPLAVREAVADIAVHDADLPERTIRSVICATLRRSPDPGTWRGSSCGAAFGPIGSVAL